MELYSIYCYSDEESEKETKVKISSISEKFLSRIIFMKINIYGREEKYFFS